jgi:hypothetical protein
MIENVNNNSSQSEQTIHFVENVRTRNNTYRQKDIILFLHESLDLMTKLIESIRVKLIEHQYRNTVRSPIDIPIAQFVKEVNDRFGNNDDILEAITKKATDLATQIKDKLIDTGADLAETAITFSMSLTGIVSNVSLFFLNSMILGTSVGLITTSIFDYCNIIVSKHFYVNL